MCKDRKKFNLIGGGINSNYIIDNLLNKYIAKFNYYNSLK
jgi:hypothetical protein